MSWKYSLTATCDECGANIVPPNFRLDQLTTLESVKTLRWAMQRQWAREGTVMQGLPNMAGRRKLWCRACADSPKTKPTTKDRRTA